MHNFFSASRHQVSRHVNKCFDPAKVFFKNVQMINAFLLQDVVDSYRRARRTVCHMCYYKRRIKVPADADRKCKGCKKLPQLLLLIPASTMCNNFERINEVPIHSPPKVLLTPSHRYVMCERISDTRECARFCNVDVFCGECEVFSLSICTNI